jgi:hypothetical protein
MNQLNFSKELPELNCIEHLDEGVEKVLDNPSWGGKSKVISIKLDRFIKDEIFFMCLKYSSLPTRISKRFKQQLR